MVTAERTDTGPRARRRRWWPALAAALGTVLVTAGIGVAAGPGWPGPGTSTPDRAPTSADVPNPLSAASGGRTSCLAGTSTAAPTRPTRDTDASGWLRLTAAALAPTPADAQTGTVTYIRLHEWAGDMTVGADKTGRTTVRVSMSETWFAADGSATAIITTFPNGTASPGPDVPGATSERHQLPAGSWHNRFPGEPSSDPLTLAGQLDQVQPARVGSQARARALGGVAREYVLPCPVRAAALVVLAQSPVIWRGETTDRAGRTGIAISVDSTDGVSRETLILDPATGVLLTHEETILRNPGKLAGPFPQLRSSTAYIETGRRNTTPA